MISGGQPTAHLPRPTPPSIRRALGPENSPLIGIIGGAVSAGVAVERSRFDGVGWGMGSVCMELRPTPDLGAQGHALDQVTGPAFIPPIPSHLPKAWTTALHFFGDDGKNHHSS